MRLITLWARSPSIQVKQSLAVIFERSILYRTAAQRRFAPALRIPVNNRPHSLRARTPPPAEKSTHFAFHAFSGTSPSDDSMFLNFQDLMKFKVFLAAKLPL
jgi:hypothetical protein